MVETGPGTVKLANLPGTHDDIVTAVGMVVADLAGRSEPGPGTVTNPADSAVRIARTARGLGPRAAMGGHPLGVTRDGLRGASRNGSRGIAAILVPGSANEPWIAPGRVEGLISLGGWGHACTEEVSR